MTNNTYFILDDQTTARAICDFDALTATTEAEAIREASHRWDALSKHDQRKHDAFCVCYGELNEDGAPEGDNWDVIVDILALDKERELVSTAIADGSLESVLAEAWEYSLRHPSCEYRVMLDLEDGSLWTREMVAGSNAVTFRERDGIEVCLHTFCDQNFSILDDWAFLNGADEANQFVRNIIGEEAYTALEAKAADEDMEPYRLAAEDDSIRDRLVDAAIAEYSAEYQREAITEAMDAIEEKYNI